MNDFDYEVMQKKRIAASARRRVNGSKSRMCSLPSDNLTPAEIKKRSGPCMTYKLNAPMDWETFKAMPTDLQVQYVKGLNSRFNVGLTTISQELFSLTNAALRQHFDRHGVNHGVTGSRLCRGERDLWESFLNGNDDQAPVEEQNKADCAPPKDTQAQPFAMATFSAEWVGEFTATEFIEQLTRLPIPAGRVRVKLEVVKE